MSFRQCVIQTTGILREKRSLKGKSSNSARWVRRQWRDPAVKQAKREGLRSRAALKLRELNQKHQIIKKNDLVLDLGAAPGGWTQIAVESSTGKKYNDTKDGVKVVAVDLLHMESIEGAGVVVGDFRQRAIRDEIDRLLGHRKVNVLLSDMAPSFSGNTFRDSQAQLRLCHNALQMAHLFLAPGGHFATKILKGEDSESFRSHLKEHFESVKGIKPSSSRPESSELFLVAKHFKP